MLSSLPPSPLLSAPVARDVVPLLAKELHDGVLSHLVSLVSLHISFLLRENILVPSETATFIAKEMGNTKQRAGVRRAFCVVAGGAFWGLNEGREGGTAAVEFSKVLLPAFEGILKAVAMNPLGSATGPSAGEGYVALAVMLGPVFRQGIFGR